jgi:capsular exopolysaccharide synthesis family protein
MEERKPSITGTPSPTGSSTTDSVAVRTQADILKSFDLAGGVVRDLKLATLPEFSPHPGLLSRLFEGLGLISAPAALSEPERQALATDMLLGMTSIVSDGRSYVIDIKVKMAAGNAAEVPRVKQLTTAIANDYAASYVRFTSQVKSDHIRQANGFFDERIASLQTRMQEAATAVQAYRAASGLVEDRAVTGAGRPVTIAAQQMAQLNANLMTASAERAQKEASLDQIALARAGRGDISAVPEVVASPLIQRLREQQAEIGARTASSATNHGAAYPDLGGLRASAQDVAGKIAAETATIAASLRSAVDVARTREATLRGQLAELQAQVSGQGQSEIRLNELQSEAETTRLIYTDYLKREQETANEIDMQEPDAVVVSRAVPPLGPIAPTTRQYAAAGIVISCFLAALIAVLRERLQAGFRTTEQFETSIGIGALGLVPKVRDPRRALMFEDRHAPFSEAISSVRALLRLNLRPGSQIIMVTSAEPQEGKTLFAAALARNTAMAGERVLLVDCDLRRPAVARTITTTDERAVGVVAGSEIALKRDTLSSLEVTSLLLDQGSPQDLFASPRLRALLDTLRKHYDLIVLDAPPVLAVSDARVLAGLSDATVLVVCWQKTAQQQVGNAIRLLRAGGARVAGAVITQVKTGRLTEADGAYADLPRQYAA